MSKIEKISIALTADMAEMVREAVGSGDYATASEVVREALRDWKTKRSLRAQHIEELRQLLAEAEASGTEPWDGVEGIIAEGRRRIGLT